MDYSEIDPTIEPGPGDIYEYITRIQARSGTRALNKTERQKGEMNDVMFNVVQQGHIPYLEFLLQVCPGDHRPVYVVCM